MEIRTKRNLGISVLLFVIAAAVVYGFIPKPVAVDAVKAATGPLSVVIDEQARTQVKDRYVISSPVSGFLRRVTLRASDRVEKDMRIAVIEPSRSQSLDPRSRAEAEASAASARAHLAASVEQERAASAEADYAASRLARLKPIYEKRSIAKDTLDQAESEARRTAAFLSSARAVKEGAKADLARAEKVLANYGNAVTGQGSDAVMVHSPVAGRVLRVLRENEGAVTAGEPILEVGNPDSIEVRVEVLSSDAVKIARGTPVVLERWGGEKPLSGVVRVVEPGGFTKVSSLGVEEQRVVILVDITTPPEIWKGLGDAYRLDAGFIVWEGRDVLQIPAGAVFRSQNSWAVFTVENGRARLRNVKTGHGSGLSTEILSGLKQGDLVITHPDDTIRDGTRILVRNKVENGR